jgi:hypothetical protein
VRRSVLTLLGFASGVGAPLIYRRLLGARRGRVEIYFADGSFVTFAAGSTEADRLLPLAQQVFTAARPA